MLVFLINPNINISSYRIAVSQFPSAPSPPAMASESTHCTTLDRIHITFLPLEIVSFISSADEVLNNKQTKA